ncbi:MAG: hypothetical protein JSV82_07505 [Planctomycetota bacterium]|nr:MAG: hypothetical protein JSV82_07505 [Planctomycetota bacterium]
MACDYDWVRDVCTGIVGDERDDDSSVLYCRLLLSLDDACMDTAAAGDSIDFRGLQSG